MDHYPDCSNGEDTRVSRRGFVKTVGAAAAVVAAVPRIGVSDEAAKPVPESLGPS